MRRLIFSLAMLLAACQGRSVQALGWRPAQIADLAAVAAEGRDGLAPPSEAMARFTRLVDGNAAQAERDAAADILFQALAIRYARGATAPESLDEDWHIERPPPPDLAALEARLAAGDQPSVLLQDLAPHTAEYLALRRELQHLRQTDPNSPRIAQARANMERWRWLPRDLPATRIEVRIAEFRLYLHRPPAPPQQWNIIVGARRTPSPVFQAPIDSVTLNPSWTPPRSIVLNELAPRFQQDPSLATLEEFDVLDSADQLVDPASVDWKQRPLPYRLRQRPGPRNALGQIRMNLPNPYAIYLHDTLGKSLFERQRRALSHGCIRVQNPLSFAAALAPASWNQEELQRQVDMGEQATLILEQPVTAYILYFTTALSESGDIVYLDDVYRRDRAIVRALDGDAPAPPVAQARGSTARL